MPTLTILAGAALATLAALFSLAGFVAVGALFPLRLEERLVTGALRLLLGAAVASFLFALLTWAGQVTVAIYLVLGIGIAALVVRRRAVVDAAGAVWEQYRAIGSGRLARLVALAIFAIYWINALAPPRDGDVVRYHLAHIRQILADGAWQPLADYHYALPFGWSLSYLPFERFAMPLAAHYLNLGLGVIAVALLFSMLRGLVDRRLALGLCAVVSLQPLLVKTATTAHADMYVIFVVVTLTALLARGGSSAAWAFALGFAGWIATQSRYQSIALGWAATLVMLVIVARGQAPRRRLGSFAAGAGLALLLASPFYIYNLVYFANPFWPLLVGVFNNPPAYADQMAAAYSQSLTGAWSPVTVLAGVRDGLFSTYTFPIPLVVFGFLLVSLKWRTAVSARLALFLAAFLLAWVLAQPSLYLRFFIYLTPVAWVGLAAVIGSLAPQTAQRVASWAAGLAAVALAGATIYYSLDAATYAVTGDQARYHRTTWFYDVYGWINEHTAPDSRLLVVLTAGPTYYLDRPYRRADPWLSGVVDWSAIRSADELVSLMRREGYDYLLYEYRNWRRFPGGDQMIKAVDEAMASGQLRLVRRFDAELSSSRVEQRSHTTPVLLLQPPDGPAPTSFRPTLLPCAF